LGLQVKKGGLSRQEPPMKREVEIETEKREAASHRKKNSTKDPFKKKRGRTERTDVTGSVGLIVKSKRDGMKLMAGNQVKGKKLSVRKHYNRSRIDERGKARSLFDKSRRKNSGGRMLARKTLRRNNRRKY